MSLPNDQQLEAIWAQVPPDYYFKLNSLQKLWHEWKWLVIKNLAQSEMAQPKKILEVGCAAGHLTALISSIYPETKIIGIDVYKPAIREAKERYPHLEFRIANAQKLPFRDNTFDLVVSSETIEHVVDPDEMLAEIRRVLTPNGRAIIEMDSGSRLFRIIWWFWTTFGKGKVWREAHLHPFSSLELERVISKTHFKIRRRIFSHFGMAVSFLLAK